MKQVGDLLPDTYDPEDTPQGARGFWNCRLLSVKKNKVWIWTALDHFRSGILGWVVGDRSAKTLIILWQAIANAKLR
ncbi:MAG: IS1 family transposase [Okeania sp. SIO1H6]|nr:IS1 family transposase [Okeania sp. SIO1H6]